MDDGFRHSEWCWCFSAFDFDVFSLVSFLGRNTEQGQDSGLSAMCFNSEARIVTDASPLTTRVTVTVRPTLAEKHRLAALARQKGLSEAKLALIALRALLDSNSVSVDFRAALPAGPAADRITIRLRPGDRQAIRARARGRGMRDSAYLAALARSHVAANVPLAADELRTLKDGIAALRRGTLLVWNLAEQASAMGGATPQFEAQLPEFRRRIAEVEQQFHDFALAALKSWESHHG